MHEVLLMLWLSLQTHQEKQIDDKLTVSPIENKIEEQVDIDWKSWLVYDLISWASLWSHKENHILPMASLTKLMTALLIIENHELDWIVSISTKSVYAPWAKIYLHAWEWFKVIDLLKGLLIRSWNDTAIALAEHHSWTEEKFVIEMNKRAKDLWLTSTSFENASWLDSENHYSNVRDLALLTKVLLKYEIISDIVSKKKADIYSVSWRKVSFYSTNHLLWWYIKWVKTWTTENAWECLITLIERDWRQLLFILLGSSNRFDTTEDLINFVFNKI